MNAACSTYLELNGSRVSDDRVGGCGRRWVRRTAVTSEARRAHRVVGRSFIRHLHRDPGDGAPLVAAPCQEQSARARRRAAEADSDHPREQSHDRHVGQLQLRPLVRRPARPASSSAHAPRNARPLRRRPINPSDPRFSAEPSTASLSRSYPLGVRRRAVGPHRGPS
jgi:hypothetical protein